MKVINQSSQMALITHCSKANRAHINTAARIHNAAQNTFSSALPQLYLDDRRTWGVSAKTTLCCDKNKIKMQIHRHKRVSWGSSCLSHMCEKLLHGHYLEIKVDHMLLNTAGILFNKKVIIFPTAAIRALLEILMHGRESRRSGITHIHLYQKLLMDSHK